MSSIIVAREHILQNIFMDKTLIKNYDKITLEHFKYQVIGLSFNNWISDERIQPRWDILFEAAKQNKLKYIFWLRSPFGNGKNNTFVIENLLNLQKLGVKFSPNITQLYSINSKEYYLRMPKEMLVPSYSVYISEQADIDALISRLPSIVDNFANDMTISKIRVKTGFSAHGEGSYTFNISSYKYKHRNYINNKIINFIQKNNENTYIFQPYMNDYIMSVNNNYTKIKRTNQLFDGQMTNEVRFFYVNGELYPKVVTSRINAIPKQKWIAIDKNNVSNPVLREYLIMAEKKANECLKWYKNYYGSFPLMLRIDVLLYGDKAYITEIETESGIGPILCEGMICDERLKKTSKQHLKFFEGIRDGILQIILQNFYLYQNRINNKTSHLTIFNRIKRGNVRNLM